MKCIILKRIGIILYANYESISVLRLGSEIIEICQFLKQLHSNAEEICMLLEVNKFKEFRLWLVP